MQSEEFRCRKCLWFDNKHSSLSFIKLALGWTLLGYCRKHKPNVYVAEGKYYGGWPVVDIDDFCGEFRADEL